MYGEVLTEHIGDENLTKQVDKGMTDRDIYEKDIAWLDEADIVVAEVTIASLGVGYEIGYAEAKNKK